MQWILKPSRRVRLGLGLSLFYFAYWLSVGVDAPGYWPDSAGYLMRADNWREVLGSRSLIAPAFLTLFSWLDPRFTWLPIFHVAAFFVSALGFCLAVSSYGGKGWEGLAAAVGLCLTRLVQYYHSAVLSDMLAVCLVVTAISFLFLALGSPNRWCRG